MHEQRYRDWTIYRRVLLDARDYWPHIAGVFLLTLLATPVTLLGPLPLKIAVDGVLSQAGPPAFLNWLLPPDIRSSPTALLMVAIIIMIGIEGVSQLRQ